MRKSVGNMSETGYDYTHFPDPVEDDKGRLRGARFYRHNDTEGYVETSREHIELHAAAAARQGYVGAALYISDIAVEMTEQASTAIETIEQGIASVIESLPDGSCDISVYHYDIGAPIDGFTEHIEPARWGAKTYIREDDKELYGYGDSPLDALISLRTEIDDYLYDRERETVSA